MKRRNTIQKNLILNSLKQIDHPTAEQIYFEVKKYLPSISPATVYRNLSDMIDSGNVKKINSRPDKYDVVCDKHYHFKCNVCNKIQDLPIKYLDQLDSNDSLGNTITEHEILFKGICADCKK